MLQRSSKPDVPIINSGKSENVGNFLYLFVVSFPHLIKARYELIGAPPRTTERTTSPKSKTSKRQGDHSQQCQVAHRLKGGLHSSVCFPPQKNGK